MRVIVTIEADLEATPLGTRSRLARELAGVPILRRTVERIRRAPSVAEVFVLCPAGQAERCGRLLEGTGALVRGHQADPPPWAGLARCARKWALDGWRGGVGGSTVFDEYTDCRLIGALLRTVKADVVLSVPPAAPLIDPDLAARMIERRRNAEDDARLVFTQAPPGIAGILLDATLVHELADKNIPMGAVFSYKPDDPRKDLIFESCCCEIPAALRFAAGRLIADTDRAMERLVELLRHHPTPDLTTIGKWLADREANRVEPLPREVEIELTTDDPYPHSLLRPRGERIGRRSPIDPAIVERIAEEITRYDDALCVLGGFGDPLRHPQFTSILERLRPTQRGGGGVYGLAVHTAGVDLDARVGEALVAHGVDILCVSLDAWTPTLYGKLQCPPDSDEAVGASGQAGGDAPRGLTLDLASLRQGQEPATRRRDGTADGDLDDVVERLNRLAEIRERHKSVAPIVVPEMCKARDNVDELDEFYDGWLRRLGTVSIVGYSHRARQLEDLAVINMAPPSRTPCRRIRSRCLVLADGRVAVCDEDFRGLHTVGSIGERSLEEIWRCAELEQLRTSHTSGRFDSLPLCAACDEWHRP